MLNFNNKARPQNKDNKKKQETFLILQKIFMMAESQLSMLLRANYFLQNQQQEQDLKY